MLTTDRSYQRNQETSNDEINQKFLHFTQAVFPLEDEFKEVVWSNKKVFFSERENWLKNLSLVTSKGYYIKVSDIIPTLFMVTTKEKSDSFDIYLDGILKAAYCFAYNGEYKETLRFILDLLNKGKIQIFKSNKTGDTEYFFHFVHFGYSYI